MGYYIEQTDSKFLLRNDQAATALMYLQRLLFREDPMCGYFIYWEGLHSANTLEEALEACRFEITRDPDTLDFTEIEFIGEKMGGKEKEIFRLLAKAGAEGFVLFRGEDGAKFHYEMVNGEVKVNGR